jgi:hypothetical protein
MTSTTFFFVFIPILAVILLAVNLIFAPHNPIVWFGKSKFWDKLSNFGEALKLLVPSYSWKTICGWTNHSETVTSQNMIEYEMGYRGSKSVAGLNSLTKGQPASQIRPVTVKEQRVDGSWCINLVRKCHGLAKVGQVMHLRCTLVGFERNYPAKIPSNQINLTRNYSQLLPKLTLNPWYITGFALFFPLFL